MDRVRLYVDLDRPLHKDELTQYRGLVVRRSNGEPTQYLVGRRDDSAEATSHVGSVQRRAGLAREDQAVLVPSALCLAPTSDLGLTVRP